eukprot:1177944-Prorocentrum_minimum.AAC.1
MLAPSICATVCATVCSMARPSHLASHLTRLYVSDLRGGRGARGRDSCGSCTTRCTTSDCLWTSTPKASARLSRSTTRCAALAPPALRTLQSSEGRGNIPVV